MNLKRKYAKCSMFSLLLFWALNSYSQVNLKDAVSKTGDEFVGPFKSWLNAKTGFGAKGDGVTDDTRALQAAFNAAGNGTGNSTLYLPPGTYLITGTLTINNHLNISIVGANPVNTIIKWGGVAHGTMMQINGTAYSKFDRLTWNGNRIADVAVEQSWDGKRPSFDTSNEYADDIFVDVGFGIRGGALGHGFAEISILRDQFIRNTTAGVSLGNFNALDIWIRNSLFQDCAVGVTNMYGAGNFKVYQCVFRNSGVSDISMNNTGEFSIRGNTSVHSKQFFYAAGSRNPASTTIEGNTVIDPVNTQAITIGNQGAIIFIHNTVRSLNTATTGPVAKFNSDVVSANNTFTISNPVSAGSDPILYNDKVVPVASLRNLTVPAIPAIEPNVKRKIYEVPAGAGADVIQDIINKAVKSSGSRPVVHFPYGNFNIATTLFIPAHSDVQLVGDGYGEYHASILTWTGTTSGPIISIAGPGKAVLRDVTFKGNATSINILITNADQKGSRIFLQEFNQKGGQVGLLADQLDHALILAYDTQFSGLKKAVSIVGGPLAALGKPAEGRTIIYSGAASNNSLSHEVSDGGNLVVQDSWYEGGVKSTYVKLSGKGFFTAAGDHISTPQHTATPSVVINNFTGKALFTADYLTDRFAISGNGSQSKILALGILTENEAAVADTSSPKADMRVLQSRTRNHGSTIIWGGSYPLPDVGIYEKTYVMDMISDLMKVDPLMLTAPVNGACDIRLYRVMSLGGAKGLDIEAGAGTLSDNMNK
ncbi:glycosyl hydrolase family 28-related protein [Mucilaginibacter sp. McL0603]|uniref:right-handed parallel beta-helix repeat-containing protein n=1 Tax=Mucilaginibacter sp. McL0603 TaxID=3415670 RepID=UPI003CF0AA29